jgi:hypothetical protein
MPPKEGQLIHNPTTGEYREWRGGQWIAREVPDYSKAFEQKAPEWTKPVISAAQGMTFNNFDELVGAVAKVHGDSYEKARDRVREAAADFAKENPKTDLTLNVLGSLPTLWLPGGQAKTGASVLQKSMAVLKPAATYGALSAAGASEAKTPEQLAGDVLSGSMASSLMAGGLGVGGKIIGGVGRNIMERIPEGAVMPMVAGGQAVSKAAEKLRLGSAQQRLSQLLQRDVEAKMPGMNANPYDVARARLSALGGRSPIAATGRNVASELDLLASMPGSAETLAEREARRISTGRGPTLQAAAAGALKEGQGLPTYVTDMIEQRRTASEPLYKQVNSLSVPVDKELEALLKRSESAHGLAEVTAKVSGKPIDLSTLRAEDTKVIETTDALMNTIRQTITTPGSQVPFEALDKVKQSLYDAATAAKKGGHTNLGAEYDRLRKQLTDKLDRLSPKDAQGNSVYRLARETFAGPSQLVDAAETGAKALSMEAAELREAMRQMTPGEQEAFKIGAAQAFKEKLGSQSGQTQLMSFTKNPNIQERIDLVFGKDARQFKKSLLQEAELKKLERSGQGSQTFKRMAGAEDQARTMEAMQDVATAASAPSTIPSKMMQWAGQLSMPEQTRNQLAKMLLMRGPQAQQELNILEEYMRKKANADKAKRMAAALGGREIAE